jgi:integrase/recombinase XerD
VKYKGQTRHKPRIAALSDGPYGLSRLTLLILHVVRHSTAQHLLQSGVDLNVIALWLGHASPATTHMYMQADLTMKEQALNTLQPPRTKAMRYQPPDRLLQFLEGL